MSVLAITKDNFEQEVLHSSTPVILDFWAPWCGPCRMLGPTLEQLAQERSDIKVAKVNVDEQMELASQFGIVNIPTLIVFKDGKPTNKSLGVQSKSQILSML